MDNNSEALERWPIDYDALRKGDLIPASRIEQITGKTQGTDEYRHAIRGLKDRIMRDLEIRGNVWTLAEEKGSLRVLTDAEAAAYNDNQQKILRQAQVRRHRLECAVDVRNLTDEQRKEHDRCVLVNGLFAQAMRDVRQQLPTLLAHRRTTPALANE